jgi:uncharacterized membrane protein YeaQ/YmgE (transglycosylase-associated protein family)
MMAGSGRVVMIENVLVGVFGAFIGGEFLAAVTGMVGPKDTSFHFSALMLAAVTALALLLVLKLMRGAVGPMRAGKSRARDRR